VVDDEGPEGKADLDRLGRLHPDELFLGDGAGDPPDPAEVLDELRRRLSSR
jgi:hypothetical protein